jgi:hypothetical protein
MTAAVITIMFGAIFALFIGMAFLIPLLIRWRAR